MVTDFSPREFDMIVLGATGYTGSICAEHVIKSFPTNFKWAVAGRSFSALERLRDGLKLQHPDRIPPSIVPTSFDKRLLHALARRSHVVINGVGPYHRCSEPVVEACAAEGTHYVDL
jgi:short subunit dehydrogenase-like uncharacterized protein